MRFGLMYDFRNPQRWYMPAPDFYRAMLDQMVEAEGLGFDHVWLTEHHFTEDAYNPASLSMAAAIAVLTQRIRIGTFVMLMPFIHPVRAAEDVALADILSNGRFDLGVGQGYTHDEFNAFCMDRKERAPRLREGVALMHLDEARVERRRRRAAELGANLMTTLGPDPAPLYLETLRELGQNPDDFRIAQLRMVYCAEDADQAWDDVAEHLFHVFGYYERVLGEAADVEGDDQPLPFKTPADIRGSEFAEAALMIGTPDEVSEKLAQFCDSFACTDFILSSHLAGLDPTKSSRSNALFAREVMPRFRDR